MKLAFLLTAATVALTSALPAFAQGIGEMGSVYALPKGGPGAGLSNSVNNLYNRAAIPPPGSGGSGSNKGTRAVASPASRYSPEDIASYTTIANKAYTAALTADKAGKHDVALKQYSAALAVRESVWGITDPAVADIARKQATIYKRQGDLAKAEASWRKVLACEQRSGGAGSPEAMKTIATLATLCDEQGNNRDALSFYKQLFAYQRRALVSGPDSAAVKPVRIKLVSLLTFTGDYQTAESHLKEGIAAEESSAKPDKTYVAQLYDAYGALMREMGRDSDASAMEAKASGLRTPA